MGVAHKAEIEKLNKDHKRDIVQWNKEHRSLHLGRRDIQVTECKAEGQVTILTWVARGQEEAG